MGCRPHQKQAGSISNQHTSELFHTRKVSEVFHPDVCSESLGIFYSKEQCLVTDFTASQHSPLVLNKIYTRNRLGEHLWGDSLC